MLPQGWAEASLGDCSEVIQYGLTCTSSANGDGYRYIRITDLQDHKVDWAGVPFADADRKKCAAYEVRQNDLLFARTGATVGKSHLITHLPFPSVFASYLIRVACNHDVLNAGFAGKFFQSPNYWRQIYEGAEGTGQPNFNGTKLAKLQLVLPPVPEQRRIVEKLDALTARLARARAELDRVSVVAERLRETALNEAFSGRLTANWRELSGEEALSDTALDEAYSKVALKKRSKPALSIEWKPNLEIPSSWRWVSLDRVLAMVQYGSSEKTSDDTTGVPVLRMGNIRGGKIDWGNLKYLPMNHGEFPELLLSVGDILFNRTNSIELVGKTALFEGSDRPVSFASYLIRLRTAGIRPELLVYYINSPIGRSWIDQVASQQVGQANVNGTKLKGLGIPLPPPAEQAEMSRRLTKLFRRAARMEAEAKRGGALLDRLESAILATAFRGELVPQDPNDEPASVLLDRIRAQRAVAPALRRASRAAATRV